MHKCYDLYLITANAVILSENFSISQQNFGFLLTIIIALVPRITDQLQT